MSDRVCYSHRTCALVRWGGDEGNRTPNPCLAKAVLCQLSYVPAAGQGTPGACGQTVGVVASRQRSASALAER